MQFQEKSAIETDNFTSKRNIREKLGKSSPILDEEETEH